MLVSKNFMSVVRRRTTTGLVRFAASPIRSHPKRDRLRTKCMKLIASKKHSAAIGVISGLFGLGMAELSTGFSATLRSPVIDVGDRVIDAAPPWLKNVAIDLFGTADKIALLAGIGSLLAVYAAGLGLLMRCRRTTLALVGVALFGAVGAAASLLGRTDRPLVAALPSLLGALAAGLALITLSRSAEEHATSFSSEADGRNDELVRGSRRHALLGLGVFAAGAVVAGASGRALASRFNAGASRAAVGVRSLFRTPQPPPASVMAPVDGIKPFITPNDDFYRIDTALTVPQVPADTWSLRIHGMVDRELTFTYDELFERELVEQTITLTCVSNQIGGNLLGTAVWGGIRLDDLLAEAGISQGADQIVGRSVDGWTAGIPVSALDGRDALVAFSMNGEPLPLEHGFPARLIVPGLYGYVSATKWLTEIELTTFAAFDQYWVPRGWDAMGPIKTQSRIDTPKALANISPGTTMIAGTAWAQTTGIERVEVRIDEGDWQEATLAEALNDVTWRQWFLEWEADPGRHAITVRATDRSGFTQIEERSDPMPNGATGWHQTVVLVEDA